MTLKHVKFEDSVTMRSLEKVAREKGWVQSEPIKKNAGVKKTNDYSVTENLTENVIKLCTGLRNSGFNKYADELESNFMAYKKATSMYDTTGEKGEDLVDAAHPEGSHKLEGVDGDSIIETIIDQHMKDVTMVNKKPTGKLSTAEIIGQVKIVLGQATEVDPNQQINIKAKQLLGILKRMLNVTGRELNDFDPDLFYNSIDKQFLQNPTLDNLNEVKTRLDELKSSMSPGFFNGLSKDTWSKVEGTFEVLNKLADQMIELRKAANANAYKDIITEKAPATKAPAAPTVAPEVQTVISAISDTQKKIIKYKAIIEAKAPANFQQLDQYLDKVNASLSSRLAAFNKLSPENQSAVSKIYLDKLNNEIVPGLTAFEGAYVNS